MGDVVTGMPGGEALIDDERQSRANSAQLMKHHIESCAALRATRRGYSTKLHKNSEVSFILSGGDVLAVMPYDIAEDVVTIVEAFHDTYSKALTPENYVIALYMHDELRDQQAVVAVDDVYRGVANG
jgi:hypothetical protein